MHPAFAGALRRFAASDVTHAEARRLLIPVATRIGKPRPSYPTVVRVMLRERRRAAAQRVERERLIGPVLAGRVPRL